MIYLNSIYSSPANEKFCHINKTKINSDTRERLANEIIPKSAEISNAYIDVMFGAANALDLNLETAAWPEPSLSGASWLKITLNQEHCLDQVIWYFSSGNPRLTWTCTKKKCKCNGLFCGDNSLTVSSSRSQSSVCGDSVMLEDNHGNLMMISEIAITEKAGNFHFHL